MESQVMKNVNVDYIWLLEYLKTNSEQPYSNPEAKGLSLEEKKRLIELKQEGQIAIGEMKKVANKCKDTFGLDKYLPGSWLDGSNTKTRKYLWTQMKYRAHEDEPISVSLFVEKNDNQTKYRVSLEIKNDGTNKDILKRYHSHLDMPIKQGMVYVAGSNEWGNPEILDGTQEEIKTQLESGELRKVQLSIYVDPEPGKTNEQYDAEIMGAVKKIIPYYEYVVGTKQESPHYWPSLEEYNPGISVEQWIELLHDTSVTYDVNLRMFMMMLECGGESTCANLAEKYGEQAATYIAWGNTFAGRVHKATNCPLYADGENQRIYTIAFVGRDVIEKGHDRYSWKLRDELREALESIMINEKGIEQLSAFKNRQQEAQYSKNMILYGPPGTGKTYATVVYAVAIIEKKSINDLKKEQYDDIFKRYNQYKAEGLVAFTTFHQSYGYEEFIEGIKPVINNDREEMGYTIEDGVFKTFCAEDKMSDVTNRVFIIDEINRGNISKIFGELITLIEDTKRAGMDEAASAILPYSGEIFSVPSNVYILGTMNTADRSIALMDTALRRRFEFVEMMPDTDVLRAIGADKVKDLDVALMLEKINERITFLYDREHTIGHAFFTKLAKQPTVDSLKSIFEKSVIPLLQEYFYEDYQKIQLVLGDNGKSDNTHKFILDSDVKVKDIFKGNVDDVIDLPEKKYSINKDAFSKIDSYKEII